VCFETNPPFDLDSKNNLAKSSVLYMQYIYLLFIHIHVLWLSPSVLGMETSHMADKQITKKVAATKEVASVVTWSTPMVEHVLMYF
jgi:hypothetical protein